MFTRNLACQAMCLFIYIHACLFFFSFRFLVGWLLVYSYANRSIRILFIFLFYFLSFCLMPVYMHVLFVSTCICMSKHMHVRMYVCPNACYMWITIVHVIEPPCLKFLLEDRPAWTREKPAILLVKSLGSFESMSSRPIALQYSLLFRQVYARYWAPLAFDFFAGHAARSQRLLVRVLVVGE